MTKTAARSDARRFVLTKIAAETNWAHVFGPGAMAIGGALGGSAVTGDDQSMFKRLGKGLLSALLLYAGHKFMTDQNWQSGLNAGIGKVRDTASGLIGKVRGAAKSAEADDYYVEGFCKAAESLGIDPVALYQQAVGRGAVAALPYR